VLLEDSSHIAQSSMQVADCFEELVDIRMNGFALLNELAGAFDDLAGYTDHLNCERGDRERIHLVGREIVVSVRDSVLDLVPISIS